MNLTRTRAARILMIGATLGMTIGLASSGLTAAAANTASAAAPTTSPPRAATLAPSLLLNCGFPVSGDWDWYRIEFGYTFNGSDLVEWGIDYGDGRSFTAHDRDEAIEDVYWHKYTSPGIYPVTAWVIDSLGRRADTTCTFAWFPASTGGNVWTPSNSDDGYDSGDLDCEDIGEEVYIDDDDPNGLDADGDGVGCEGW